MDDANVQRRSGALSVLSVPVSACDRRALSEAWYAALHKSRSSAAASTVHRSRPQGSAPASRVVEFQAYRRTVERAATAPQRPATRRFESAVAGSEKSIGRAHTLARRIERTFFSHSRAPTQANFVLQDGRSRVHVVVRRSGGRVHLVALCTASARAAVAIALREIQGRLNAQRLRLGVARIGEIAQ